MSLNDSAVSFDYSELEGKIKSKGLTQAELAKKIGMTPTTLSLKLNGQAFFKQKEISRICSILDIEQKDIGLFFYAEAV